MIKKTIAYTDYNGVKREEEFYFNLSKSECVEMEVSKDGKLSDRLKEMVDNQDMPSIISFFKTFVLSAYGEKSEDGRRFIKNNELREAFSQTEAYSELFMELASDSDKASAFVNAVLPSDLEELK